MKAMNNDENSHPKTLFHAIYLAANWIPLIENEVTHQAFTTTTNNLSQSAQKEERSDKKGSKDNKNKDEKHSKKEAVDQDDERKQNHNQK
jgi:hypothetical protein